MLIFAATVPRMMPTWHFHMPPYPDLVIAHKDPHCYKDRKINLDTSVLDRFVVFQDPTNQKFIAALIFEIPVLANALNIPSLEQTIDRLMSQPPIIFEKECLEFRGSFENKTLDELLDVCPLSPSLLQEKALQLERSLQQIHRSIDSLSIKDHYLALTNTIKKELTNIALLLLLTVWHNPANLDYALRIFCNIYHFEMSLIFRLSYKFRSAYARLSNPLTHPLPQSPISQPSLPRSKAKTTPLPPKPITQHESPSPLTQFFTSF